MAERGRRILLCTLGMTWPVVPESYALLAPHRLPLYRNHPQRREIEKLRTAYRFAEPDELWLCTTDETADMLAKVQIWWRALGQPGTLRIWIAEGSGDLADADQVRRMRELTLRLTLLAAERCADRGQLVLSLAGGRKTMSADLQRAGQMFGCAAMLHIVGPAGSPPAALSGNDPQRLTAPLTAEDAQFVMPVILGAAARSELLDVEIDDQRGPVISRRFPIRMAGDTRPESVPHADLDAATLDLELQERESAGARLFGNFLRAIDEQQPRGNWRSLYRAPPRVIQALKDKTLEIDDRDWLVRLPKAELHCHLGGMLDLAGQREVACSVWETLPPSEKNRAWRRVGGWIRGRNWPDNWPAQLRAATADGLRHGCAAALLSECPDTELQRHLFEPTEPRVALRSTHPLGFAAYELPGELSGSALLQTEAAIEPYAQAVIRTAKTQGLRYLELRGSPQKYLNGDGQTFLHAFHGALRNAIGKSDLICRFVIIVDRRRLELAARVVKMAVALRDTEPDFIAGLDLAGAEGTADPQRLADAFAPAFAACLPITIHAGEGESAENIWQAAYWLHADRIGHGLTLVNNLPLLARFRDRDVCIELCPTSNREVVGFRDPAVAASDECAPYPLAQMLKKGLRVTLCTDNPGISRTTLADEYLTAARMSEPGHRLTRWDALILVRQAFKSAFLPSDERARLIKAVDHEIFMQMTAA